MKTKILIFVFCILLISCAQHRTISSLSVTLEKTDQETPLVTTLNLFVNAIDNDGISTISIDINALDYHTVFKEVNGIEWNFAHTFAVTNPLTKADIKVTLIDIKGNQKTTIKPLKIQL